MSELSLGDVLVERQLISAEQHRQACRAARRLGSPLVQILLEQELVDEKALFDALRQRLPMPSFDPSATPVEEDAVRLVPCGEATRHRLLPVQLHALHDRRLLQVAMVNPLDRQAIEDLEFSTGAQVEPLICRSSQLDEAIRIHYRGVVTKVIQRPPQPGHRTTPAGGQPQPARRRAFGGDLSRDELGTVPVGKPSPRDPALEALVNVLVHKGLITREEFESEFRALDSKSRKKQ